jgi:hypothetical protein
MAVPGVSAPIFPIACNIPIPKGTGAGCLQYTGTSDPYYKVGTCFYDADEQKGYMYVLNEETSALDKDDPHFLKRCGHSSNKWSVMAMADDTLENYAMLCVPACDIAASSYGWVQIYGTATVEEATCLTDQAWTAGCELCVTAGKIATITRGLYGFQSAAGSACIALAAASSASTATTREIELIGTLAATDS